MIVYFYLYFLKLTHIIHVQKNFRHVTQFSFKLQQICDIVAGNEKLFEVDDQVCNCVHQEEEQTTFVSMGLGK